MQLDISKYINKELDCSCGRKHFCPISAVVVENNAILKLADYVSDFKNIIVVADTNTFKVAGQKVLDVLKDKVEKTLVFDRGDSLLVPDERAIKELTDIIDDKTDLVIGIGSGVINDICKYVTFFNKKMDYYIVATAPSMDGYASSGAAMIIEGMKVTYTTRPPKVIIADVDVVKTAPEHMISAGYGDIIGKYSALNDWKLSKLINDEYFCPEIYDLVMNVTNETRNNVKAIMAKEDEAIAFLTKALILIGVTLSLCGSTRPGSGSEHHLSHCFEIVGLITDKPYFLHGIDVGFSTFITAGMREELCKIDKPVFAEPDYREIESEYKRIYRSFAGNVAEIQKKAKFYGDSRNATYIEKWDEVKKILGECPKKAEILKMLTDANYNMQDFINMYGREKITDACFYGKDLKERYSVLWIYYALKKRKDFNII